MKYFFLYLLSIMLVCCTPSPEADTLYINGAIWTGDSSQPTAHVIAIKGEYILYVGNDTQTNRGVHTQIVDLQGKTVLPGFMDNHTHFLSGGYNLSGINLREAKSPAGFIQIVKEFCANAANDSWVLGGDWDHEAWGGELPTRHWIDSVCGNHPVFLVRYDGHMACANSRALALAKIDRNTQVPAGGEIVKDKKGEPTGVLKDEAMNLVNTVIPPPSEKELDEFLSYAVQHALQYGVTQLHDMGSYGGWTDLETYRRAYRNNNLPIRIYSFVPLASWQKMDSFCQKNGKGNDQLRWGGLKGFVDGSLGSTTAWFYSPYLDAPQTSGFFITDTAWLRKAIPAADGAGLQIAMHAIGDRANDFILDVFEETEMDNTQRDRRFRIEHAQHLKQNAIPRFAKLGVIPSMQPYHAIDDGRWAAKRLDSNRLKGTYAFKSLLDHGAKLSFGSDWTVAPLNPIMGIYAAVTRRTLDGKNPEGWFPEQKISVAEAIRCYTVANAYAGFQENRLGMLKKGFLADMVVLSEDIFRIKPEDILHVKVLRTIVGGREAYIQKQP